MKVCLHCASVRVEKTLPPLGFCSYKVPSARRWQRLRRTRARQRHPYPLECLSTIYLSIYDYQSTNIYYLSIYLFIHPSIHPSIYLSFCLAAYVPICLSAYLSSVCLTIYLSNQLSICITWGSVPSETAMCANFSKHGRGTETVHGCAEQQMTAKLPVLLKARRPGYIKVAT